MDLCSELFVDCMFVGLVVTDCWLIVCCLVADIMLTCSFGFRFGVLCCYVLS